MKTPNENRIAYMVSEDPCATIDAFLIRKLQEGELSKAEYDRIVLPGGRIARAAAKDWSPEDPTLDAVSRHIAFQMKKILTEVSPELAAELREFERIGKRRW